MECHFEVEMRNVKMMLIPAHLNIRGVTRLGVYLFRNYDTMGYTYTCFKQICNRLYSHTLAS